jgi:hypothetical protein
MHNFALRYDQRALLINTNLMGSRGGIGRRPGRWRDQALVAGPCVPEPLSNVSGSDDRPLRKRRTTDSPEGLTPFPLDGAAPQAVKDWTRARPAGSPHPSALRACQDGFAARVAGG